MSYLQASVLGLLQGLTEFLPVSSSAHLALAERWFGLPAESDAMLLFNVSTHVGTVAAVAIVFARTFLRFLRRLRAEASPRFSRRRYATRITLLGVTACVPTAVIGLAFKEPLQNAFGKPGWIAAALVVTGLLLWASDRIPRPTRGWRRFGWGRALAIGVAQGCAIMPGISRSGATICIAELLGIKRRWAAEFSFFIAAPAIGGAALLSALKAQTPSSAESVASPIGPVLVGGLIATVVGCAALHLLLSAVRRARLHYFSYYCWALALAVFVLLR